MHDICGIKAVFRENNNRNLKDEKGRNLHLIHRDATHPKRQIMHIYDRCKCTGFPNKDVCFFS